MAAPIFIEQTRGRLGALPTGLTLGVKSDFTLDPALQAFMQGGGTSRAAQPEVMAKPSFPIVPVVLGVAVVGIAAFIALR